MEQLYKRIDLKDGSKRYACLVHGRHGTRIFKTATKAQEHSLKMRERLVRLKAAANAL